MSFETILDDSGLPWTEKEVLRVLQVYSPHRLACFGMNYFKSTINEPWDKEFVRELKAATSEKKVCEELRKDILDALERHKSNARLCAALYPVLQSAEIVTRNALSFAISEHFNCSTWLVDAVDAVDAQNAGKAYQLATLGLLEDNDLQQISNVEGWRVERRATRHDSDAELHHSNILAELDFNFWRRLVKQRKNRRDHQGWEQLWQDLAPKVIPLAKPQNREFLFKLLTNACELRNAVAHQYPLWVCADELKLRQRKDHKSFLKQRYEMLETLINGVGPKEGKFTSKRDSFEDELNKVFPR